MRLAYRVGAFGLSVAGVEAATMVSQGRARVEQ